MNQLLYVLFCFTPLMINQYYFYQSQFQHHSDIEKLHTCQNRNPSSFKHHGKSLILASNDPKDIVMCPGDTFGDLDETYVKVKDCYLEMYHKGKSIWTSQGGANDGWTCLASLERDGNLALFKESQLFPGHGRSEEVPIFLWDSQTNLNPVKTELRLQNQQIQIVQTFEDGTQRLFYADQDHPRFVEDAEEPTKVADQFIIKNLTDDRDEDRTILRRNEYIGDLNGTHLILQTNCELQLLNQNKVLWSYIPSIRHRMNCTLNAWDNMIQISNCENRFRYYYDRESIMESQKDLKVVASQISFEGGEPVVRQTLKNGSVLSFYGLAGQNSELMLKRKPKQIITKTFSVKNETYGESFFMGRMDYIGNLTGLHLILDQNCSLVFANDNKKLWKFQWELQNSDFPVRGDCSLELSPLFGLKLTRSGGTQYLLEYSLSERRTATNISLALEYDRIIVRQEYSDKTFSTFYAGPKTRGEFLQFLDERSFNINHGHEWEVMASSYEDWKEILPPMGYIGDLDGFHTILEKNCNWVLYNKTQVLWETGSFLDISRDPLSRCSLSLRSDGDIQISARKRWDSPRSLWTGLEPSFVEDDSPPEKVLKTELLIENGELWLVHTFRSGDVSKYKAMKGTNSFELVTKKHERFFPKYF